MMLGFAAGKLPSRCPSCRSPMPVSAAWTSLRRRTIDRRLSTACVAVSRYSSTGPRDVEVAFPLPPGAARRGASLLRMRGSAGSRGPNCHGSASMANGRSPPLRQPVQRWISASPNANGGPKAPVSPSRKSTAGALTLDCCATEWPDPYSQACFCRRMPTAAPSRATPTNAKLPGAGTVFWVAV